MPKDRGLRLGHRLTYAYDPWFPRLTSRVDGVGTTSDVYHPVDGTTLGAGQLARVNGPFPDDTLKYTYDELGRLKKTQIVDDATFTTASYSDEATTDFLLSQIKNLSAAVPPTVISQFDYTYNQDRTINTWTQLQNGVTTTWTFGYDPIQQLTSAVRRNSGGTVIRDERYGYDGAGNRIQVTEDGVARNAQVNNLNQLTSERGYGKTKFTGTLNEPATVTVNGQPAVVRSTDGGVPYTFEADVDLASGGNTVTVVATDGNGNVRTNQYSVPTTGVVQNYEYDLNGNTRFEKTAAGVVVREFQWDQENRLVKIIAGTKESQFTYDGESKRVRIRELDGGAETSNQTFVWCGIKPCQKRGSTGGTVLRSYFGAGFEEASADYVQALDHLGSVREVVNSGGLAAVSAHDYSTWGVRLTLSGVQDFSDEGFAGSRIHLPSLMGQTRYRMMNPRIGRWVSRDLVAEADGAAMYLYVGNSPISKIDPLGLWGVFVNLGFSLGFGLGLSFDISFVWVPDDGYETFVCAGAGLGVGNEAHFGGGPIFNAESVGDYAGWSWGGQAAIADGLGGWGTIWEAEGSDTWGFGVGFGAAAGAGVSAGKSKAVPLSPVIPFLGTKKQ